MNGLLAALDTFIRAEFAKTPYQIQAINLVGSHHTFQIATNAPRRDVRQVTSFVKIEEAEGGLIVQIPSFVMLKSAWANQ